MNHMHKKYRYILFSIMIITVFISIIFTSISFSMNQTGLIDDKIDNNALKQIDVDNILLAGLNGCITNELLSEKGYSISEQQIFSEIDNAIWYDCTKIPIDSPLPVKAFSIQLSKNKNELVGYNFHYAPIDIEDENLAKIISIYANIAGTDAFTARSGDKFTYSEISTFSPSDFKQYGSRFEILNTSSKKSIALYLEIDNSGEASFYGVVSKR